MVRTKFGYVNGTFQYQKIGPDQIWICKHSLLIGPDQIFDIWREKSE